MVVVIGFRMVLWTVNGVAYLLGKALCIGDITAEMRREIQVAAETKAVHLFEGWVV